MNTPIEVGLIGYGMAGKVFHAPLLDSIEGFTLSMIKTSKEEDIRLANRKYPNAIVVPDVASILEEEKIQLIVIASPNGTHFELAKQSLQAGKHVVVDKPFTVTTAEAEELISLAEQKKRILSVYQNRRWDSDFLTVAKLIKSNALGKLVSYEAHFDRFRNTPRQYAWKEDNLPGSGILYDLGSHLIDQALCLLGKPSAIFADVRIQRAGGKAPDYFWLQLYYPDFIAKLTAGMLVKSPAVKYLITGHAGSFIKFGMDVQEDALKSGKVPLPGLAWGEEPETLWGTLDAEFAGQHFMGKVESEKGNYPAYYLNIFEAITNNAVLSVQANEARQVIELIELAMKSSIEKKIIQLY